MLAPDTHTLFLSDLHLSAATPQLRARFLDLLATLQTQPYFQKLYLLGDIFEYWIGDDLSIAQYLPEINALRALHDAGKQLFWLAGNRDFLVKTQFANETGVVLLPDPSVIVINNIKVLISHGDAWCTDDSAHQSFRQTALNPSYQANFLALPAAQREQIATMLRQNSQSKQSTTQNSPSIGDVNPQACAESAQTHHSQIIIHGHTHRPARHVHQFAGQWQERWVLPDWRENGQWGYLTINETGWSLYVAV